MTRRVPLNTTLIDASDLQYWSDTREAQDRLPRLVRRLIFATNPNLISVDFPAGDAVSKPGWDGVLSAAARSEFVPAGHSGWELSVESRTKRKADYDYAKRSENPLGLDPANSTFVFVTPRRWNQKRSWERERVAEGVWASVRAFDADDLELWLSLAPAVHIQFSIELGKRPAEVEDLGSFWLDWSGRTTPPTPPELLLPGRSGLKGGEIRESDRVLELVRGQSRSLAMCGDTREEVVAFIYSSLSGSTDRQRSGEKLESVYARTVVLKSAAAFEDLCRSRGKRLILITMFDDEVPLAAVRAGHSVIAVYDRAGFRSGAIALSRLRVQGLIEVFRNENPKLTLEAASVQARLARASLSAFRRERAAQPTFRTPEWASSDRAQDLIPFLLAGGWRAEVEADRHALEMLSPTNDAFDALDARAVRWAESADPPIRLSGASWRIISAKVDAWRLLVRFVTPSDLRRLHELALNVLSEVDATLMQPAHLRLTTAAHRHSATLRREIVDTFALLGGLGGLLSGEANNVQPQTHGAFDGVAESFVRALLTPADDREIPWASLGDLLPRLAEAAPRDFLHAVKRDAAGSCPILQGLFKEIAGSPFRNEARHVGLCRSLEVLAWSEELLPEVARRLADLYALDSGGNSYPRPGSVFQEIFRPWHPCTAAAVGTRNSALKTLVSSGRDSDWHLVAALLPSVGPETAFPTATPQYRDWAPEDTVEVRLVEVTQAIDGIIQILVDTTGVESGRWKVLLEALSGLPHGNRETVIGALEDLDLSDVSLSDKANKADIWEQLLAAIEKHRAFEDADWSLPLPLLNRLERFADRIKPTSARARNSHLFSKPALFAYRTRGEDWQTSQTRLEKVQTEAVQEILDEGGGYSDIKEAAELVELPWELGRAFGSIDFEALGEAERVEPRLFKLLDEEESYPALANFAQGAIRSLVIRKGLSWIALADQYTELSPAARALLLLHTNDDEAAWAAAERLGPEIETAFWTRFQGIYGSPDRTIAAKKLVQHGRPSKAAQILAVGGKAKPLPSELLTEVLEAICQNPVPDEDKDQLQSHAVSVLLSELQRRTDTHADLADPKRVAALEFAFVGLHGVSLRILFSAMARDPKVFVDVIGLAFRPDPEDDDEGGAALGDSNNREAEADAGRAHAAYRVLHGWRELPGQQARHLDSARLRSWIDDAREQLSRARRLRIGDLKIGELLSASPLGADNMWPHEAVRDLIEEIDSDELRRGIFLGWFNGRGVSTRAVDEGGAQERAEAARYKEHARRMRERWPATADVLVLMAEELRAEAARWDLEIERFEDGLG